MLREYTDAAKVVDLSDTSKYILWMYIPDWTLNGKFRSIPNIPAYNSTGYAWTEETRCAGDVVGSDCPFRFEEMEIISYTPTECEQSIANNCNELEAFVRFNKRQQKIEEAQL